MISEEEVDLSCEQFRIVISAPSASGKTTLAKNIILKYGHKYSRIIICGVPDLNINLPNQQCIEFYNDEVFDPFKDPDINTTNGKKTLICFDDLMLDKSYEKIIANCFVRGRHIGLSSLFLTHNLFHNGPFFRLINLNSSGLVIFKSRDLRQIKYVASTFLPKEKVDTFMKIYSKYVSNVKYGYIYIDFLKSFESPLFIRTNIANENFEICIQV